MHSLFQNHTTEIRTALFDSIPASDGIPEPRFLYTPNQHAAALDPQTTIVCGIRGAGKSVWTRALSDPKYRQIIQNVVPRASLTSNWSVQIAFNEVENIGSHPNAEVMDDLFRKQVKPRDLWLAIIMRHLDKDLVQGQMWKDRALWVAENLELVYQRFDDLEAAFVGNNRPMMLVFDALDRCSATWEGRRLMLKALLQIALQFRTRRGIRLKLFLRPDMLVDPAVGEFADFSKLQANRADLSWSKEDLYGLLWQYLANAGGAGGKIFRDTITQVTGVSWANFQESYQVDKKLRNDHDVQRMIFEGIAGKWMGSSAKQGFPFTWLPSHLADSKGQVSPRSFLAALREASKRTPPENWPCPLHYQGIKTGVTQASRIRVDEISEDFAWVADFMQPLTANSLLVPCDKKMILDYWNEQLLTPASINERKLHAARSPSRLAEGGLGVIQDLFDLGILHELPGHRIQMPDVFRVAFGLGRKGGIPPVK